MFQIYYADGLVNLEISHLYLLYIFGFLFSIQQTMDIFTFLTSHKLIKTKKPAELMLAGW